MEILAIVIECSEQLGDGGAFDHPDGETCAAQVREVVSFDNEEDAVAFGVEAEEDSYVIRVDFSVEA